MGLIIGFPAPIIFALFLNELKNVGFKRFVQTVSYLPHFVSWVIFGGIIINLLSPNDGIVNELLLRLNVIQKPIHYLAKPEYFWSIAVLSNTLKSVGFGAILYIASIMGVNPELYEAATIDGAGWLKLHSKYSIYVILFSFRS